MRLRLSRTAGRSGHCVDARIQGQIDTDVKPKRKFPDVGALTSHDARHVRRPRRKVQLVSCRPDLTRQAALRPGCRRAFSFQQKDLRHRALTFKNNESVAPPPTRSPERSAASHLKRHVCGAVAQLRAFVAPLSNRLPVLLDSNLSCTANAARNTLHNISKPRQVESCLNIAILRNRPTHCPLRPIPRDLSRLNRAGIRKILDTSATTAFSSASVRAGWASSTLPSSANPSVAPWP